MFCSICGTEIESIDDAIDAGWLPSFYDGDVQKVYANDDLNDGLIAYFPFEGNAQDVSGNSNHGTEVGAVSYTDGAEGLSATFDGTTYITAKGAPFTLDEWTISFWVNIEETS